MDYDSVEKSQKLKELIETLYDFDSSSSPSYRNNIISGLVNIGESAVEYLINALENGYEEVRNRVDRLFRELESERKFIMVYDGREMNWSLESIKKQHISEKFEDWVSNVRSCAARALGEIGDQKAVESLIRAIEDDDAQVRLNAAFALGEIGDIRGIEYLINTLDDEEDDIRINTAQALGKMGDSRVIEPLLKEFTSATDHDFRKAAKEALENLCSFITTVILGKSVVSVDDLRTVFYNPDVSELTSSLCNLNKIIIDTVTYDFRKVERFITYAVNYIGKEHLKNNVEVHIYGDPKKLHQNLHNLFNSLCKKVEVREGDNP